MNRRKGKGMAQFNIGDIVKIKSDGVLDPETNYDFSCIGGAKKMVMEFHSAMDFYMNMLIWDGYRHSAKIIGHGADRNTFRVEVKFKSKRVLRLYLESKSLIMVKPTAATKGSENG